MVNYFLVSAIMGIFLAYIFKMRRPLFGAGIGLFIASIVVIIIATISGMLEIVKNI